MEIGYAYGRLGEFESASQYLAAALAGDGDDSTTTLRPSRNSRATRRNLPTTSPKLKPNAPASCTSSPFHASRS
jgi:hypothetical protein